MVILNQKAVDKFGLKHAEARKSLATWTRITREANWQRKLDILESFSTAKIIAANRARFEIVHNKYRLIAEVNFNDGYVEVRFVGSHAAYDRIDPATI